MEDSEIIAAFKTELATLLRKYNASIGVDVDGDTHGLMYDFTADIGNKTYVIGAGYNCIDASDLDKA